MLPVYRVFQRKLKMVPKKDHFLAFLRHPLWPINIVVAVDGQAEWNGATFASWDTFNNSQEHREFSNLVTLKTAKVSSSAIWLICLFYSCPKLGTENRAQAFLPPPGLNRVKDQNFAQEIWFRFLKTSFRSSLFLRDLATCYLEKN